MNEEIVAVLAAETMATRNAVTWLLAALMKNMPHQERDVLFAKYREGVVTSPDYADREGPIMDLIRQHLPDAADRMIADVQRVL